METSKAAATFDPHEAPTLTRGLRLPGASPLVLVVDDDPDAVAIYSACLTHLGYRTAEARSGEEGVEAALAVHPTAILMDVAMPGIGGLEAIRRLKRDERTRDCLVIVITAFGASAFDEARTAGCDAYFCKPFNAFALDRVLGVLTAAPEPARAAVPTRVLKRCGCGREYGLEAWLRLGLCGRMHTPQTGRAVELRNCQCGSSLVVSEQELREAIPED